jgi:CDP-diacylglycerol--glycerol-3-phosphate 3-phosphatidyltransferase
MPTTLKNTVRERMLVVGRILGSTGISPDALTLIGLLLNIVTGAIVAAGMLTIGGAALLIASAFDMLDGAVARATGRTSRFGAFLDSLVDRYSEAAVFVGLAAVFARQGDHVLVAASALALTGSLLVSYARARAEGLGLDCEVGLLQRPERVIILAVGLLIPFLLVPIVWLLAVVTNLTVLQRALHVRRLLQEEARS